MYTNLILDFPSGFMVLLRKLVLISCMTLGYYRPCQFYPPWFVYRNNIWRSVVIMKLLIIWKRVLNEHETVLKLIKVFFGLPFKFISRIFPKAPEIPLSIGDCKFVKHAKCEGVWRGNKHNYQEFYRHKSLKLVETFILGYLTLSLFPVAPTLEHRASVKRYCNVYS
jgi:hypothetical protein